MTEQDGQPVGAPARLTSAGALEEWVTRALLERGLVTEGGLEQARHQARWLGESAAERLVRSGELPEEALLDLLAEATGVPVVSLASVTIEAAALDLVPPRVAAHYRIMPIRTFGGTLTLATDRAGELEREEQLRLVLGVTPRWILCRSRELSECVKHYYGVGLHALVGGPAGGDRGERAEGGGGESVDASAFVHEMLEDAVRSQATDVHIEPFEDDLRLRYRIDGVLASIPLPSGAVRHRRAIVSAIKVMAQLNIAEHRHPQDGRFSFPSGGETLDIRVSVLPTPFGEAANLRILNREGVFLQIDQLGLRREQQDAVEDLIMQPHGLMLFTGATGSGKTTSLYAALARLNSEDRKIITIEDPVEYQMEGVVQMQVQEEIGFTFASGLRSVLRHDPDTVLIGEIRDAETARIAISAAMTGHLVFSTLHTNDSVSAAPRLIDMGIEPYLVASSLQGVVAQQLLRRVCGSCREAAVVDPGTRGRMAALLPGTSPDAVFYVGRGCPDCRFTGYRGRRGVFEILVPDDALRALVAERASSVVLLQHAIAHGLVTLRQAGWLCALDGVTTVDEVMRVTPGMGHRRLARRG